ncbi:hypothetical protein OROMI_011393 [Orobanche minor]
MQVEEGEDLLLDVIGNEESGMITFDGKVVHGSTFFRYLGSIIQKDGELDGDVAHRIKAGWLKWKSATGVLCDPDMPHRLKGKFYRTAIRPALLYGTECWAVKQCHVQKMNVAEMRMLRWMCGHTKKDRLRNEVIREKVRVAYIEDKMMENRLRWFGHVRRRPVDAPVRRLESWGTNNIVKGRGRPKRTWIKLIENDMRFLGIGESMISSGSGSSGSSTFGERLLSTLLTEMDDLELVEAKGIVVLAATNRPYAIDAALTRRGRFDFVIYVPPPDLEARHEILRVHTRGMKVGNDVDLRQLAEETKHFTGAELEGLCREAGMEALREDITASIVNARHFRTVKSSLKPTLTKQEIDSYAAFMKKPIRNRPTSAGNEKRKKTLRWVSIVVGLIVVAGTRLYLKNHS